MGLGWQEMIVILILALVLFGPKRLPEIGSSLGRSIREFRASVSGNDTPPAGGDAKVPVPVEADNPPPNPPQG